MTTVMVMTDGNMKRGTALVMESISDGFNVSDSRRKQNGIIFEFASYLDAKGFQEEIMKTSCLKGKLANLSIQ